MNNTIELTLPVRVTFQKVGGPLKSGIAIAVDRRPVQPPGEFTGTPGGTFYLVGDTGEDAPEWVHAGTIQSHTVLTG